MGVKVKEWKGAWWVFINYKGKRKTKRVGSGPHGKKAAELAAIKIQAKLADGDLSALETERPQMRTLREYGQGWLESHVKLTCKPNTYDLYRSRLELHWFPFLGSLPLTAITRERIRTVLAEKLERGNLQARGQRGLKAGTLRAILIPLLACLSTAVEDGLISTNPATKLGRFIKPSADEGDHNVDPLTREELEQLLKTAEADKPELHPFLLMLARTGMRQGEGLGLKWADVDFKNRAIWVRRTWYRGRVNSPKSGRTRRVDMSRQLQRVLEGWYTLKAAEAAIEGRDPSGWVFPGPGERPLDRNVLARGWGSLVRRAGLRPRPLHSLRHSYASQLIQQGVSLAYIRDQLGHSSIQVTVDIYGHLVPGANRQAVDALDDPTGRNPYATEKDEHPEISHISR